MMAKPESKSLMRNLGEFFGHVMKGVRTPATPKKAPPMVVKKEVQEQTDGAITYRRTTIDEIEVDPPDSDPDN